MNPDTVSPVLSFDAFSPVTQNEYRITLPPNALRAVGRSAEKRDLDRASPILPAEGVADSERQSSGVETESWSNGDDDRYRAYGLNALVTNSVHRRLVQLGGGCSGTLVGPRHVVTAGHCLWNRETRQWSNNFWVRAGANGTSFVTRVRVDNQNIPAGQVLWYFTPLQFRNPNADPRPYDFGILVVPARLGDVTGWLGRYHLGGSTLASSNIYRRGYPACNAAIDGEPRIDEPSPCSPNHLYANAATCEVGEFAFQDASGWRRNLHHSCDASAGDSGSALYVFRNNVPGVTAIHIASECETTATDAPCNGSLEDRPLRALRITPEYSDWIAYFRDLYP